MTNLAYETGRSMLLTAYLELLIADLVGDQLSVA